MAGAVQSEEQEFSALKLFTGNTGGIDSWLSNQPDGSLRDRLGRLREDPLSLSQFNQFLALAHQATMSQGFFDYYWFSTPLHSYDVSGIPGYDPLYTKLQAISSIDHLAWGLYRIYTDALLYYGSVRNGYRELRNRQKEDLERLFAGRRFDSQAMTRRGPYLGLVAIPKDHRYLISEMACKSFDLEGSEPGPLLGVLKGAWAEHVANGGGKISFKRLLDGAYVKVNFNERQGQFVFSADELLELEVETEAEMLDRYSSIAGNFAEARQAALTNTDLYLSMADDLDVYVATSMRSREDFRQMAATCDAIFAHPAIQDLHIRYFDPTMSAAQGHEDKGLIECLMVKCAKVLLYCAGARDSFGKDVEAAMALSLGKPVIFFCEESARGEFFKTVHPLSRLIDFQTGVVVGVMAASKIEDVVLLISRIFNNKMAYEIEQPKPGLLSNQRKTDGIDSTVTNELCDASRDLLELLPPRSINHSNVRTQSL